MLLEHVFAHKWVGRDDPAESEDRRFSGHAARNRAEADQAERKVDNRRNGQKRPHSPLAMRDAVMVVRNPFRQRHHHRHGVVGNFLQAIIGNVDHRDAEVGGRVQIDVVHADAVANHATRARQRLHHAPCDRRPLHQQRIGVAAALDDLVFGPANRLHLFQNETGGFQHVAL